ncbi:MAG: bifunctional pyr operon transcriptional regulator/uracil phosphoribosyltransferase PyrR [Deltaproteobacteria bacterium]
MTDKLLMDPETISRSISRMATEILERNRGAGELLVIGVRTRGIHIAERIVNKIAEFEGVTPPLGTLDITLYRDDFRRKSDWPQVQKTHIPFSVEDKCVILVDDVLYTGRTTRAAIEVIMDYGRPSSIQLAVLVDRRGHRELPIQADYAGNKAATIKSEQVRVLLREADGEDGVYIQENKDALK